MYAHSVFDVYIFKNCISQVELEDISIGFTLSEIKYTIYLSMNVILLLDGEEAASEMLYLIPRTNSFLYYVRISLYFHDMWIDSFVYLPFLSLFVMQ